MARKLELELRSIELIIDGKPVKAWFEVRGRQLWAHWGGQTRCKDLKTSKKRSTHSEAQTHPGKILSPMPGKIIEVKVSSGQEVNSEDVVVVMEAMKMEYSLKAGVQGQVKSVSCQKGAQTVVGELLVEIVPNELDT